MRRFWLSIALGGTALRAQGVIGTFAGTEFLFPADRMLALSSPLGHVQDVALDSSGNYYVSDRDNHVLLQVRADGTLAIYGGNGLAGFSGDGGLAVNASLRSPQGIAFDAGGNLYVADSADHRIRKIATDGTITTAAGTGQAGFNGDGGALSVRLNEPRGVAVDAAGNLYIADSSNNRVRKVAAGAISTFAGNGQAKTAGDGGPASLAGLNAPTALVFDGPGNLYIATTEGIRKVARDNTISSVKITLSFGGINVPAGLAVDSQNNLYVSDAYSNAVFRIAADGTQSVVAGNGTAAFAGDGGPATKASLANPGGLEVSPAGTVFVADRDNLRVRRIEPDSSIRTAAGSGQFRLSGDGQQASSATLSQPVGIATDALGDVFIADLANNRIRKITTDGMINTAAGNGVFGFSGDNGPATSAALASPQSVSAVSSGFYIADRSNNLVRKVDVQGIIRTVAGGGSLFGGDVGDNGPATKAVLRLPFSVATDGTGNLYIADTNNDRVRKVAPDGTITTFAGGGNSTAEGVAATDARLNAPQGLAVDSQNRVYISDTDSNRIRVVTGGRINTIAGGGNVQGENVAAGSARVDSPRGLAFDVSGNLYFAEANLNRVRRLAGGFISTVAGAGGPGFFAGDGGLAINARLDTPTAVALDSSGNLYIADSNNNRIRKVFAAPPAVRVAPTVLSFSGVEGGLTTAPRLANISSDDLSGLPYAATLANNSSWLNIFPVAGLAPASLEVSANPAGLKPGVYNDTLRIVTPNANPALTLIQIQFTVAGAGQPLQSVQPDALSFAFVAGSAAKSQNITVSNQGGNTVSFTAEASNPGNFKWLSVTPLSGTAVAGTPATLSVTANPGPLPEGVYTGAVTIHASTGASTPVAVTMTISLVEQTIRLSQTGLTFTGVSGGGVVPRQGFSVLNAGRGVMKWTASVVAQGDTAIFLSVSPASGSSDAAARTIPSVTVSANPAELAPGEYFNQIKIESPTALNSPQFIPVVIEVLAKGQDPGPYVQPSELVFVGVAGSAPPSSQDLIVYNLKGSVLNYRSQKATANGLDWIQYLPTEASVGQQPRRLVVQTDTGLLTQGVQQGVLTLSFDNGFTRKINILAVVLAPGASASAKSLKSAQGDCVAKTLVPSLTVLGQNFIVPAGFPAGLIVNVVDDCGLPLTEGAVRVAFTNGDVPLSLDSQRDGSWTGTWIPGRSTEQFSINVIARSALGLEKSVSISGTTRSTLPVPRVNSGGVVNAANFAGHQPLALGGMIVVFGTGLANGETSAPRLPLTTQLSGTSVVVGGRELPLIYAGDNQVNAILPYDLKPNAEYQLLIANGRGYSDPERIVITDARPVIFQTSLGPAVVDSSGRIISSQNPVKGGDVLLIFAAGLGPVKGTVVPGAAPGALPTVAPVSIQIGGIQADVAYAGLSPEFPGLYQVNVTVPSGLPSGDVPLVMTTLAQSSPEIQIRVR